MECRKQSPYNCESYSAARCWPSAAAARNKQARQGVIGINILTTANCYQSCGCTGLNGGVVTFASRHANEIMWPRSNHKYDNLIMSLQHINLTYPQFFALKLRIPVGIWLLVIICFARSYMPYLDHRASTLCIRIMNKQRLEGGLLCSTPAVCHEYTISNHCTVTTVLTCDRFM